MKKLLICASVLVMCAGLAGCTSASPTPTSRSKRLTEVPKPPASPTAISTDPIASGIVDTVLVNVYEAKAFRATNGCGCTISKSSKEELFPKNTAVLMLRITLTGNWKPSQGKSTTQDVTGVNLKGTKFDGRPEEAVLDTADGPEEAASLDLPWLPAGLFKNSSQWLISNGQPSAFVAAWYVPQGVDRLLLTVDVPNEPFANKLAVDLPPDVITLISNGGE